MDSSNCGLDLRIDFDNFLATWLLKTSRNLSISISERVLHIWDRTTPSGRFRSILSPHPPYNSLLTSPPLFIVINTVKPTPITAPNHTSPNSFNLFPISNLRVKRRNKVSKMRIRVSSLLSEKMMEKPVSRGGRAVGGWVWHFGLEVASGLLGCGLEVVRRCLWCLWLLIVVEVVFGDTYILSLRILLSETVETVISLVSMRPCLGLINHSLVRQWKKANLNTIRQEWIANARSGLKYILSRIYSTRSLDNIDKFLEIFVNSFARTLSRSIVDWGCWNWKELFSFLKIGGG